ncbi:MAG TPA: GAF domain-containing protein [Anaerolineales bacterium]|nr:GAF domain-containing protein [Anaerolineales bacterium]HLO28268.1 GAF domain-containing protein [Anaerolineales bacterium]
MIKRFSHDKMLRQLGGWYLTILVAIAQMIALFGAIPGILSIKVNAKFEAQQLRNFSIILPVLIISSILILLYISRRITPTARKKLDVWADNTIRTKPEDDLSAWREITSLSWRYGIAAVFVISLVDILPIFYYSSSSMSQPAALDAPDPTYVLIGAVVSLCGSVIFATLLIERFTLPLRLILLPKDFETQLKGHSGLLLNGKFLALTLALIIIAVLLIAPIGYQHTFQVLYVEISSIEVFRELRVQSILFSVLALMLGAGFSYYVAKSISDPVYDLIKTFNKIEQGDLTQRAPVKATDELGIVTVQFNRMVSRLETLQTTLEQQVVERTKQLAATNEVGRVAASSLDPEQLFARIIPLFHEQFGYYFAAIYLLDPSGKWAELKEATGEAGKVLKQNHHRLDVAGKSMVGTAIRERSTRIAQVASEEKQRFDNPLLPYTRSEVALPLIVGERVLGALNVQSTKEADFGPQVIETMKNMVGQVAIAMENARLFQEAQQIIREMRTIQQHYLFEGWSEFSEQNQKLEYRIGDEMDEDSNKLETPISLRDQILGQIVLEGKDEWTADQQSLVDAIATQAAIALENARLVSESRHIALRERMVAEINSKIWSSATIDGVLQTVVKELGRRLDASSATVELSLDNPIGDET